MMGGTNLHYEMADRYDKRDITGALHIAYDLLNTNRNDSGALYCVANSYVEANQYALAYHLCDIASRHKEQAEIYALQAYCLRHRRDLQLAKKLANHAISLNSDNRFVQDVAALVAQWDGDIETAEQHVLKARALEPEAWGSQSILLSNLAYQERYDEAFELLDVDLGNRFSVRREWSYGSEPRWDGGPTEHLMIYGDQGLGDEIMFYGLLPKLEQRDDVHRVGLDCDPRLASVLKRSFPWIEVHGSRREVWHDETTNKCDERRVEIAGSVTARCAAGSLPKHLGLPDGLPYLMPDSELVRKYRNRLESFGKPPYVGIAWTGGQKHQPWEREYREVPKNLWFNLFRKPGTFVSLRYEDDSTFGDLKGVHDILSEHDYEHTLALIKALHLVIAVPTTAVHAAGAVGTECWVPCPRVPQWRFGLHKTTMPWHNSIELFRQTSDYAWSRVMNEIQDSYADFRLLQGIDATSSQGKTDLGNECERLSPSDRERYTEVQRGERAGLWVR